MKKSISTILLVINVFLLVISLFLQVKQVTSNLDNSDIKITLTNTSNSNVVEYEYKVEGINNEWLKCNGKEININYLPKGNYNIIIRPILSDGSFGEDIMAVVNTTIPFWKRKSIVFLNILIILIIIIYNKIKINYLDKEIKIRTKSLINEINKNSDLLNKVMESEKNRSCNFVNMSHELRTPINVISSTCQLVMELNNNNQIDRDKLNHYMNSCRKNSMNLLEIINDIIDIAKMKNDSYPINIEKNDIVSVVEDSALTLKDYIEQKGIELIIDPDIEEKVVDCDKHQIERCIINLVGNAFKFTNPGGFIKIFIKDYDDEVQIEVQDNGKGIAKENHESIFNRFNQVLNNKSAPLKGSGLGLAITKQIIEKHNGSIRVESELGKGSNFIINLPVKYTVQH